MPQDSGQHRQERQVRIEISDDVADGVYANMAFIANNSAEFIIDFARFLPGNTRGRVVSRVVVGPQHAKALLTSLTESVERYEKQHGDISPEAPNRAIGFTLDQKPPEPPKR